ncbi:MAG: 2-hydroxy-3-keto-5-methylthiopentenyl-1-phosphate phosphatase [Ectobacillus sp.]
MSIQIFCDFDGTVTESDNIVAIMKQFGPPEVEAIIHEVLSKKVSIREGVSKMFALLPASLKDEIINFIIDNAKIRPGFAEFLRFVKEQGIEFYIVSGGMDFFIAPLLDDLVDEHAIYCNATDFSGEYIHVNWIHSCDGHCKTDCGLCKPSIIRKLGRKDSLKIAIGDSITDLEAAKLADKVFARDFLLAKCKQLGISCSPFTTFYDIQKEIKQLLEVKA